MATTQAPELRQEAFLQEDAPSRSRPNGGAPPGTSKRKPLVILTLIIIAGAIIGFFAWFVSRGYQDTDDAFIDGHIIQVSPRVSADVVAVHFDDNQEVTKGQLLVELDPGDFQVALDKARAQLLSAQAQVQQAQAQAKQSDAELARQSAQSEIAGINFKRDSSLYQQDLRAVAKQDVDTTQATLAAAVANVDAARAAVAAAQSQIGSAQAGVHVAQAAVDDAALQYSYTRIIAPASGRITRKTVEIGNYVTPAQTLFSVVQHDVWVTANFKETQLDRMQQGQPVRVHVDAFPSRDLKAHLDSFQLGSGSRFSILPAENATGNYVKVVQRVPVKIVFDEPQEILWDLAPGMSVEPRVDVAAEGSSSNSSAKP